MKRKTRRHSVRSTALAIICCLLLLPATALAAGPVPESLTMTLIRPDDDTLDILFVTAIRNEADRPEATVPLPLPVGYTDVAFVVAPRPELIIVDGSTATDTLPLEPGETRQYVYRAALPLPPGGTRLTVTLPWAAPDVLVLVDDTALHVLPGAEFADSGAIDLEGRQLAAFRTAGVDAGETVSIAVGPGQAVTNFGPDVRPTRWERLQVNLGGRPTTVLALTASLALALWATVMWRRQHAAPPEPATERARLISQIASLDRLANAPGGPPPGYEAERERLFAKLEQVARRTGGQQA